METVLMVALVAVVVVVIWKIRGDAAAERKAVMARLASEKEERGDYSPLAEVFREAGVSAERLEQVAAAPMSAPATATDEPSTADSPTAEFSTPGTAARAATAHETSANPGTTLQAERVTPDPAAPQADLRTVLQGIKLPAGLALFGPSSPMRVTLASEAPSAVVRAGLEEELERIGCEISWAQANVLDVFRGPHRARFTVYPEAAEATTSDGRPLFPGIDNVSLAILAEMA